MGFQHTGIPAGFPFRVELDFGLAPEGVQAALSAYTDAHPGWTQAYQKGQRPRAAQELIEAIFAALAPSARGESDLAALMLPFAMEALAASPAYRRLEARHPRIESMGDEQEQGTILALHAYALILRNLYGRQLTLELNPVFRVRDPATGLDRAYQMEVLSEYCGIRVEGELPGLSEPDWARILENFTDLNLLTQLLPPDRFVFSGFLIMRATDITGAQALSDLKFALLRGHSIFSQEGIRALEARLAELLALPGLTLHLAGMRGRDLMVVHSGHAAEPGCWLGDNRQIFTGRLDGSIFEQVIDQGRTLWIADLGSRTDLGFIERQLVAEGIRSVYVSPLEIDGHRIGTFGLAHPERGRLGAWQEPQLRELRPLFALALDRSLEDLENRVQARIQERYTAVHPAVAWKFRQTALKELQGQADAEEGLRFEGVFPLYAVSDIRNSSVTRNRAIVADLQAQLAGAASLLGQAQTQRPLPVYDELAFQVSRLQSQLEAGLSTGDELGVLQFLRSELEPVFEDLARQVPGLAEAVAAYQAPLDPETRVLYRDRRAYDESVALINRRIGELLDREQVPAQEVFSHYFDKTSTDGVDFNMYIGASLAPQRPFDALYLRNLRLWQLLTLVKIARLGEELRPHLPLPLELTHLLVIQDHPLTIRFREDEKRFSVDGAYNTRYEIMKKRIDKAVIKESGERLTQPGQIALVYTQPGEGQEYRRYCAFLQAKGFLEPGVEDWELEDLQGIHGLRALRVRLHTGAASTEATQALLEQGSRN